MNRGAWSAAVHGIARSRTRLNEFTFTFHFHALEKEMTTHSSVLAWRIPGMGEPGGLPSLGSHRVRHNWSDLAAAAAAIQDKFYIGCSTCWSDISGVFDFDMLWNSDKYFWNIINYYFETLASFWHFAPWLHDPVLDIRDHRVTTMLSSLFLPQCMENIICALANPFTEKAISLI